MRVIRHVVNVCTSHWHQQAITFINDGFNCILLVQVYSPTLVNRRRIREIVFAVFVVAVVPIKKKYGHKYTFTHLHRMLSIRYYSTIVCVYIYIYNEWWWSIANFTAIFPLHHYSISLTHCIPVHPPSFSIQYICLYALRHTVACMYISKPFAAAAEAITSSSASRMRDDDNWRLWCVVVIVTNHHDGSKLLTQFSTRGC